MVTDSKVDASLNAIFKTFRATRTLNGYIETLSRPQHEISKAKRVGLRRGRDIPAASNSSARNRALTPA
jgi:hypothetical protein